MSIISIASGGVVTHAAAVEVKGLDECSCCSDDSFSVVIGCRVAFTSLILELANIKLLGFDDDAAAASVLAISSKELPLRLLRILFINSSLSIVEAAAEEEAVDETGTRSSVLLMVDKSFRDVSYDMTGGK